MIAPKLKIVELLKDRATPAAAKAARRALAAYCGVTLRTVRRWETEDRAPSYDRVKQADVLPEAMQELAGRLRARNNPEAHRRSLESHRAWDRMSRTQQRAAVAASPAGVPA